MFARALDTRGCSPLVLERNTQELPLAQGVTADPSQRRLERVRRLRRRSVPGWYVWGGPRRGGRSRFRNRQAVSPSFFLSLHLPRLLCTLLRLCSHPIHIPRDSVAAAHHCCDSSADCARREANGTQDPQKARAAKLRRLVRLYQRQFTRLRDILKAKHRKFHKLRERIQLNAEGKVEIIEVRTHDLGFGLAAAPAAHISFLLHEHNFIDKQKTNKTHTQNEE